MACTTLLVGKNATYDGSTFIARNSDSPSGEFTPKKFTVENPGKTGGKYKSVIAHLELDLPDDPMRYTAIPNAVAGNGIWAASGANSANVAMTATETLTTNERVLGADPFVEYRAAKDGAPEQIGGIGEEDMVTIVLPYIRSAREGVTRLGGLLTRYGTYEMNGIAFSDVGEIWWLESVGGHHWIARRVPDDSYVVMPNQLGLDTFDLKDALGAQVNYMCSPDLAQFIAENHLGEPKDGVFNPRDVFGSHDDADHVYNTPRAWYMERYFNPRTCVWDGEDADFGPESDDIPWCRVPEKKITVEDAKYVLSSHYQGTPYDPYLTRGDLSQRGKYRSIGINRNDLLELVQIRPYAPESHRTLEWLTFGSNAFNAFIPLYAGADAAPQYLSDTTDKVTTESFYWANRLIGALADPHFGSCGRYIEEYQFKVQSKGYELIKKYDAALAAADEAARTALCSKANQETSDMLYRETQDVLNKILFVASDKMANGYKLSDH